MKAPPLYQPCGPTTIFFLTLDIIKPTVISPKSIISQARSSTLIRIYLRLFPTLIALSVIASFLIYQPELAQDFANRFLTKLNLNQDDSAQAAPQLDLISPINSHRQQHDQPTLSPHPSLNSAAEYIALSLAANPQSEAVVDLKKIASLADYSYSTIAYLAALTPLPMISTPTDTWIADSSSDILDPKFTQIGSHQLNIYLENQDQIISVIVLASPTDNLPPPSPSPTQKTTTNQSSPTYYTGTQLWQEVQNYRRNNGVPEFKQDNTLCTIASIRVNQMIELGKLDNHEGFTPLVDQFREDGRLTHTNIAENILSGYPTPQAAVAAWNGSPGHQALLRDGAYVFACTAANHGYAVLVAAF